LDGDGREGLLCAHPTVLEERCFIVKTNQDMNPDDDPHNDNPTLTHPWMRWLHRLRSHAAKVAARYGHDVKGQMIRGLSYGVGSGAVSLLIVWWENRH
jgi:hypothetical protein